MPFSKVGPDKYQTPSGRTYTGAQRRLWFARGGKFPGEKGPGELDRNPYPGSEGMRAQFPQDQLKKKQFRGNGYG